MKLNTDNWDWLLAFYSDRAQATTGEERETFLRYARECQASGDFARESNRGGPAPTTYRSPPQRTRAA